MIAGILIRSLLLLGLGWLVTKEIRNCRRIWLWLQPPEFDYAGGGLFLLYKTVREIHEKLEGESQRRSQ